MFILSTRLGGREEGLSSCMARKSGAERVEDAPTAWWEAVAEINPMACLCTSLRFPIHLWLQQVVELQGAFAWLFFPDHRYKGFSVNSVLCF